MRIRFENIRYVPLYLTVFFSESEMFQAEAVGKIKTPCIFNNFHPDNPTVYEMVFTNVVEQDRPQMMNKTINNEKRFSYRVTKVRIQNTLIISVAYREGVWGVQIPPAPEIPKALQNRAKLTPIVKTVKNCCI